MKAEIMVGDIVETCSLMPGIVMSTDGRDVEVRMLNSDLSTFSCCSIVHCDVTKLTVKQAITRLLLGEIELISLMRNTKSKEQFYKILDERQLEFEQTGTLPK